MEIKDTEQEYFNALVDSILSLPGAVRSLVLHGGYLYTDTDNPYIGLWNAYNLEQEGTIEPHLHNILDHHNLAID